MKDSLFKYTSSIHYDRRLYKQDIAGSIAHVRMLGRQHIITDDETKVIVSGLEAVLQEIESDNFPWREELEDIHMNVERRLFEKIGDVAGKLHTARSRNDQIALDIRLYAKEEIFNILGSLRILRIELVKKAEENSRVVMPGYTHLQRAQPVLFAHHMLAYFDMLGRDRERFIQAYSRADVMPLGSGALAGVPYPIDRKSVANELGFSEISSNSMDAVSDRDFLIDFQSAAAICIVHLSRLAEEFVIWSSDEFGFVRLAEELTTGSSMMPQKRNPDFAELARGKTGRVLGNLVAILTVFKGLPLTYNRDLQEDKAGFFDTSDLLLSTLDIFTSAISTLQIDEVRMREAAEKGTGLATDVADYLVAKGMPFREAHGIVSRIVAHANDAKKSLRELSLDTYKTFSALFDEEVLSITVDSSVEARDVLGGTAFKRVEYAIAQAKIILEADGAD